MQKKFIVLFISYIVILFCTVLIVGGTFSLFTDSVKVVNHLQAGSLDVELIRTNLEYTKINELGYLEVVQDNDNFDFTNKVDANIFGISDDNLKIIPGSYFNVTLDLIKKGNVAFEYSVKFVLNCKENELIKQLNVEIIDQNGNIKVKRFNEFIEDETILIGEMDNFNNKETFKFKITFLDLEENNIAKDENLSFDLVVTAVQKINE